jgi:hypothetical protein
MDGSHGTRGGHDRGELPIAGFDELPVGEIEHRVRALTRAELEVMLRHEREHADRPRVVGLMEDRMAELDAGATPSPGGEEPGRPEPSPRRSQVGPATAAEPFSAPPHGTPDQRGKPKGDRRR